MDNINNEVHIIILNENKNEQLYQLKKRFEY